VLLCCGPARPLASVAVSELEFEDDGSGGVPAAAAAATRPCALLALSDALKPDAAAGVAALHALGLSVHLLTGDNAAAAAAAAAAAGVPPSTVHAGLLPADKLAAIRALQAAGERVLFVGDGANDGPALAAADVGFAIGGGADLAVEAAGVVLVRPRVRDVAAAVELARATMVRIRANLAFSLVFNLLGVPIAAGVLYPGLRARLPPAAAAAAMAASSVAVVLSSLRLAAFRGASFGADATAGVGPEAGERESLLSRRGEP